MTEVVEYALVVMMSSLFVAGSVITYSSFSSFESGLQFNAAFAAVSGLASQALRNGSARAYLTLPGSVIRCAGGELSISSGTMVDSQSFPVACDFTVGVLQGTHVVLFKEVSSRLSMMVN